MARFIVKASEYKNVCKAVNDRKLAELKKEVIEILKKQDSKEFKKAVDYLNSQEFHYTHLEKSISGKWIEKAGYGIGTVRTWKGKKYKKVAPGKWVRVFDKEGHGTNVAIGKLISKVQKCKDVEELMALVMANKSRFVDENGNDLPILSRLRAEVDIKNEKLSGERSPYIYGVDEDVNRERNKIFDKKKKITKEEAQLHGQGRKISQIPTSELKKDKAKYERLIENKTRSKRDSLNNVIFREKYEKELDAINKELDKRNANKQEKVAANGMPNDKEYEYYKNNLSTDDDLETISEDIKKEREYFNNHKEEPGAEQRLKELDAKERVVNELIAEKPKASKEKEWFDKDAVEKFSEIMDMEKPSLDRLKLMKQRQEIALKNAKDEEKSDGSKGRVKIAEEKLKIINQKINEAQKGEKQADNKESDYVAKKEAAKEGYWSDEFKERNMNNIKNKIASMKEDGASDKKIKDYLNDTIETNEKDIPWRENAIKDGRVNGNRANDYRDTIQERKVRIENCKELLKEYNNDNKDYWVQDSKGNRITATIAKNRIKAELDLIDELKAGNEPRKDIRIHEYENEIEHIMDRLNPEDRKEMESEAEKHQNRSDAMKGNKNAYKGGYEPSESTNIETKKAIAENKKIGENEVQMPYTKELGNEMKTLKNCVSKDPNREFMNHVYYDNGNLIATDGMRLKTVKVGELDGIENGSYVDINVSKDGVNIKRMEGMDDKRFPNYARVIPDDLPQKITLKNDVIKEKIKELKKDGAIDKKIKKVQLEIKDGKLYLDDTEIGDAQGVNLKYSNDWGNTSNDTNFININADYLVNALNGDSSILMLGDRADKAVGINTDSTTNIIMPMQGSNEKMDYSENKVRKSLSDGLLGLGFIEDDELEDEIDEQKEEDEENFTGTDYNDYSAEQPELFNSTEFKVREALNRRFNCL